jgi:hypothetical protein
VKVPLLWNINLRVVRGNRSIMTMFGRLVRSTKPRSLPCVCTRALSAGAPAVAPVSAANNASDAHRVSLAAGRIDLKFEKEMYIVFTCKVCETRSVKGFSKNAYNSGVVLCRCPGCQNLHLIADNLRYFGEQKNIQEILEAQGRADEVKTITDTYELLPEDLLGKDALNKVESEA